MDDKELTPYEKSERLERAERFLSELEQHAAAEAWAETVASLSSPAEVVALGPEEVILYGFDGQVDAVWKVREPRPFLLRRPLPLSPRAWRVDADPKYEPIPVAEYERLSDSVYQRTR